MHQTTAPKRDNMTIHLAPLTPRANILPIAVQIRQAAIADERNVRRKMKAKRKERNWRE